MKKLIFIASIAILSVALGQAQEIRMGAKGGVNFATFSGDDLGDVKYRTGFHIGGLVEIPISEKFAVQPEILYSAQGAEYDESGTILGEDYSYLVTAKLDYIQVPVMAKYYLVDGLAVELGPQVGFLATSEGSYEGSLGGVEVSGEENLEDIADIDVSLGGGLSYRLPMGVFFGARYTYGLTNLNDGEDADNQKMHNNVIQISAGYSF